MFRFEIDLIDRFKQQMDLTFDIKSMSEEVPFFSRNIDMMMLGSNDEIISIEFKLHDIKTVYKQARKCLLCSDFVYVCLPKKNLRNESIDLFRESGIGIIFVENEVSIYQKAKQSPKNFLKSKIEGYL